MSRPRLEQCLAYAVACDYKRWIGDASATSLAGFLHGANMRSHLSGAVIHEWKIFGPLEQPEVYLPIVARTGHPTLAIKWATALEMLHLSQEDAFSEIRDLLERWACTADSSPQLARAEKMPAEFDLSTLLGTMARRPGMCLGSADGWALRSFLHGMARGGDWLGLPTLPGLQKVIDDIESRSIDAYGSPFGAYRVYDAVSLLEWAGIAPISTEDGLFSSPPGRCMS